MKEIDFLIFEIYLFIFMSRQSSHKDLSLAGYAHLLNVEEITAQLPYVLTEGFSIERANQEQIEEIRRDLKPFLPYRGPIQSPMPYECKREQIDENQWQIVPRDPDDFRYYVINFIGLGQSIHEIGEAGSLLPEKTEVEIGLDYVAYSALGIKKEQLLPDAPARGAGWNPHDLNRFFNDQTHNWNFSQLTLQDLDQFSLLYKQIRSHDENIVKLSPKLRDLHILRSIDPRSRLELIGYMTMIESILTHKPDPKDIHESLTKQVVNKMMLLNHRVPGGFDCKTWFPGNLSDDKIWKKIYAIRSAIAHGEKPEYKKGEIPDYRTTVRFLREVVKKLICQTLVEPELIRDLHKC